MPRRAKKKPTHSPHFRHTIYLSIVLIAMCVIGYFVTQYQELLIIPTVESDKTLVKKIPKEVKNALPKNASSSANIRVPFLLYHYVEYVQDKKDTTRQSLAITPDIFDQQVKTLQDAGFTFMTAGEVGQVLNNQEDMPKNPVVLTFDDGYRDFYTDVLPILEKYHVKATAYIVPGFLDGPNSMSSQQLADVIRTGLVEVGAHTMHHVYLKGMNHNTAAYEISNSKQTLEEHFNLKVVSFAYPYGAFDLQAIDLVQKAGFTNAVSTIPGIEITPSDHFFISRLRPGYRTGPELIKYLQSNIYKAY